MIRPPVFLAYDLSFLLPQDPEHNLFDFYLLDHEGKDLLYERRQKLTKLPQILRKNLPYRSEIVVWNNPSLLPFHPLLLCERWSAIIPAKKIDLSTVQSAFFYLSMFFGLDRTEPLKIFKQDERATYLRHEATGLKRLYELSLSMR